jgi:hypothetical protein
MKPNDATVIEFSRLVCVHNSNLKSPNIQSVSQLIALMLEAASTSETLVKFHQTTGRNNPEVSHLPLIINTSKHFYLEYETDSFIRP